MSDLIFRATPTDRTIVAARDRGGRKAGPAPDRGRGSDLGHALLPPAPRRRARHRQETHAAGAPGAPHRRDAAQRQRGGGHRPRRHRGRPRSGDDQFQRRSRQYPRGLHRGRGQERRDVADLRREGKARPKLVEAIAAKVPDRLSGGRRPTITRADKLRGMWHRRPPAGRRASPTIPPSFSSPPGRKARRKASSSPTATSWPMSPREPPASTSDGPTRSSTSCRCSTPSASRSGSCCRSSTASASISIPRRSITGSLPRLIYGFNATILLGTDTFLIGYARKANPYDLRSLRYVLAGAEPVKETTRRIYAEKFGAQHPRRLRHHRGGAGAGHQHADVQS